MTIFFKIYDYFKIFKHHTDITSICGGIDYIDLSDKANHLGDVLFFGPTIEALYSKNERNEVVIDHYNFYSTLYKSRGTHTSSSPSKLSAHRTFNFIKRIFNKNLYFVNFYSMPKGPIARSIFTSIIGDDLRYGHFKDLFVNRLRKYFFESDAKHNALLNFKNYLIFCPEIKSRKFGLYPNKANTQVKMLKLTVKLSKKHKVLILGEKIDLKINDYFSGNKNIIDLRSCTSISDLIYLIASDNCKGVVTLDTFPYHLAVLFQKKVFVYSRSWITKFEFNWIRKRFMPAF